MFWCSFGKSQLVWFPLALLSVTCLPWNLATWHIFFNYFKSIFNLHLNFNASVRSYADFEMRNGYQNSLRSLVLSYRLPSATMYQNVSECWPCQFPPMFEPGQQWVGRFQVSTEVISLQVAGLKEVSHLKKQQLLMFCSGSISNFCPKRTLQALATAHQALDPSFLQHAEPLKVEIISGRHKSSDELKAFLRILEPWWTFYLQRSGSPKQLRVELVEHSLTV